VHIFHLAGVSLIQPQAQAVEPIGRTGGSNANQLEAERVGMVLYGRLQ
jgi:hypothetical protein